MIYRQPGVSVRHSVSATVGGISGTVRIPAIVGVGGAVGIKKDQPHTFYNMMDVREFYNPKNGRTEIIYPLIVGAEIAFRHGAGKIVCVQCKEYTEGYDSSPSQSDWEKALEKLEKEDIRTVVLMTSNQNILALGKQHVEFMSDNDPSQTVKNMRERVLLCSGPIGATITEHRENAIALGSKRVEYFTPSGFYYNIADQYGADVTYTLEGVYAACAAAGMKARYEPQVSLTRKDLVGFLGVPYFYGATEANSLAEAGCTVVEKRWGRLFFRHSITTDLTNVATMEPSVVAIQDYVSEYIRATLDPLYIGKVANTESLLAIKESVKAVMEICIRDEVIADYDRDSIEVKQDENVPTLIHVNLRMQPAWPIIWIECSVVTAGVLETEIE